MATVRYRMISRRFDMLPETAAMNRIAVALIMLCAAGACSAAEIRSSDARPSMPYTGTAVMQDDGTLTLHLRLTAMARPSTTRSSTRSATAPTTTSFGISAA